MRWTYEFSATNSRSKAKFYSMRQAADLRHATRASRKCEPESVQFDDRGDHTQAQPQAFGVSTFVRAIEALGHRFSFDLGDAGAGVADPDYGLAFLVKQCELHASAFGGEFNGVVDQIGNGLEKKIAVAAHSRPIGSLDPKGDTLVLGDRVVEIAHFANQRGKLDLAKPFAPAPMLDFRNAQQRRDCGQRLVETSDRLIGNCASFLQRW